MFFNDKLATVLTILIAPVLIYFFSPLPIFISLFVMLGFFFLDDQRAKNIFYISSSIIGAYWLVLGNYDFYNYFKYGGIQETVYGLFLQSYWMTTFAIYGGIGVSILTFKAIYSICLNYDRNLQDVKNGGAKSQYKNSVKSKSLDIKTGAIGVSFKDNGTFYIKDKMLNEMLLALGTTGSGKTVFFRNLYARCILLKQAAIVVDGKPDNENIEYLRQLAKKNGVPFYGFNCGNNLGYDFLNNGSPTEIKDKIIGLKNEQDWDSDYYKTQAETYLQTALEVLKKVKGNITLDDVIDSFDFADLMDLMPDDLDDRTKKRLNRIKDIESKDLKGIQNQLTLLANSDFGDLLSSGKGEFFTLLEAIEKGGFIYFALPALKYPSFAKVLGKVVVNDLKTALYDKSIDTPVFSFFDEFGVFAGEQVLNLVNQGRGLGLHSAFGTQSIADLSKSAGQEFLEILMGNINTLVAMRVNDNKTTDYLAEWVGKDEVKDYQANIDHKLLDRGSVRLVEKYIIKPSELQRLGNGEAFVITKVGGFSTDKIKVNYIDTKRV